MRRHPVCACLMTDAAYPANFKSCDRRHKHWLPAFLSSMGLIRFRAIPDPRGSKILRTGELGSAGARAAPYKLIPLAATISKASPRRASCSLLTNLNSVFQPAVDRLLRPLPTFLPTSLRLTASASLRHRQRSPQASHVRFTSCPSDLSDDFRAQYRVS